MVDVSLVGYKIKGIDLLNTIKQQGSLQIGNTFAFNVAYTPDNTRAVAELIDSVQMVDHPEEFHLDLTIEGIFELTGIEDNESKKDAHIMCYDVLFPYANQIVTQLVTSSGMAGLVFKKIPLQRDRIQFGQKDQNEKITPFPDNN